MAAFNLQLKRSNDFFKESLEEAEIQLSNKGEWILKSEEISVSLQVIYSKEWADLVVSLPTCWLEDEFEGWVSYEIHSWPFIPRDEALELDLFHETPSEWPAEIFEKATQRVRGYVEDFLSRCPDPWGRKAEDFEIKLCPET